MTVTSHLTVSTNDSHRIPVPFHIVDDLIAEDRECLFLTLHRVTRFKSLYFVPREGSRVEICITDNDRK